MKNTKILIVDDEKMIRERLKRLLEMDDFEVLTAEDGEKALNSFRQENPKIVIADIKMPGMDGIEILKAIKSESDKTEVIMMTGHGGIDTAIQALKAGAFSYIQKPVEYDELEIDINRALERQRLKRELSQAQSEKLHSAKLAAIGELSAGVAHEIKTPLAVIRGNHEIFKRYVENNGIEDEKILRNLTNLLESVQRISKIVDGLQTFARADTVTVENIFVHDHINSTTEMIQNIFEKENIFIIKEFNATDQNVAGNIGGFQQVIMNLLSNAKDAADGKKGVIRIRTENLNDQFILKISDEGCGITKENLERVFESFFTTKNVGKGTGLGLSISYSIIKEMKGKIEIDSKVDEGTTFTITLPLIKTAEKTA